MSVAQVTPDPAGRGGFALLRVPDAAAYLSDPKFRLQRQDERAPYLGQQGWQPAETLLAPANAWTDGPDLILEMGPAVVDAVEEGTVGFSLPAGGLNLTLVWPALAPSRRGGQNVFQEVRRPAEKPDPAFGTQARVTPPVTTLGPPPPPVIEPVPETIAAVPQREDPKPPVRPRLGLYLGLGGGVLVLAAVLFFLFRPHNPVAVPFVPPAAQQPSSPQPAPAPQAAAAPNCDSEPYPAVLQCEKDPAKLFAIAQKLAGAGNMQAAVAVYQSAAGDNYGPAALALAELYDPAHFQANAAIAQPDSGQAARYYKLAVNDGDQDAVAPRANLYARLQSAAAQGDMQAPLIMNDYWP
jgi:hypothetical protein